MSLLSTGRANCPQWASEQKGMQSASPAPNTIYSLPREWSTGQQQPGLTCSEPPIICRQTKTLLTCFLMHTQEELWTIIKILIIRPALRRQEQADLPQLLYSQVISQLNNNKYKSSCYCKINNSQNYLIENNVTPFVPWRTGTCVCAIQRWRSEDRQLAVSSLLSPRGFQVLNSGQQAWQQTPAEPSASSRKRYFLLLVPGQNAKTHTA